MSAKLLDLRQDVDPPYSWRVRAGAPVATEMLLLEQEGLLSAVWVAGWVENDFSPLRITERIKW